MFRKINHFLFIELHMIGDEFKVMSPLGDDICGQNEINTFLSIYDLDFVKVFYFKLNLFHGGLSRFYGGSSTNGILIYN
ncbi:hypothetical protein BLOT_014517 [Blomia tropicalis]|nr:hypothetical protein BLOT_014517 [Blomia tropicalis]